MATIHTTGAGASLSFEGFGGIDRRWNRGSNAVYDLQNLRVDGGGALRRRCGFGRLTTLPARIRGLWSGIFAGEPCAFAAAGDRLYRLSAADGSYTEIGAISSGEGRVNLFLWRDNLICLDGTEIRIYDGDNLALADPYVPLVMEVDDLKGAETAPESVNLIGRRVRITFRLQGRNHVFLKLPVEVVEQVKNAETGEVITNWSLQPNGGNTPLLLVSDYPGDGVWMAATLVLRDDGYRYVDIASCSGAVIWGGTNDSRILCFGGGGQGEIFSSVEVDALRQAEAKRQSDSEGKLYFPLSGCFCLGDGRYPVRAACPHYDRLLIYTDGECWASDYDADGRQAISVLPINSGVGCSADGGAALAGNDPVTVADGAVWRWTASRLQRDECSAEQISAGVSDLLSDDFTARALVFGSRSRGEIWLADPASEAGEVLVYRTDLDLWYRFTGIRAEGFFAWNGDVGFWRGDTMFCFAEHLDTDDGENIPVCQTLKGLSVGEPGRLQHLTRLALSLWGEFSPMTLTAETDRGRRTVRTLAAGGKAGKESFIDFPLHSGRFRALRLTLSGEGEMAPEIRGLYLCAEPGGRN